MKKEVAILFVLALVCMIGMFSLVAYSHYQITSQVVKDPMQEKKDEVEDLMDYHDADLLLKPDTEYWGPGAHFFFGVKNTKKETLYFKFNHGFENEHSDPGYEEFGIKYQEGCHALKPGETKVYEITVNVNKRGRYGFRAGITEYFDSDCLKRSGNRARYSWINY